MVFGLLLITYCFREGFHSLQLDLGLDWLRIVLIVFVNSSTLILAE